MEYFLAGEFQGREINGNISLEGEIGLEVRLKERGAVELIKLL